MKRKPGRPPGRTEFNQIVDEVKTVLKATDLTPAERLKALDLWAKVLMIKHKVTDGEKPDGSLFAGE